MDKLRIANSVLFWGGMWGFFEATVGYLLHLLPVQIGYLVWFPAAIFFLDRAYKSTKKTYVVILVAIFAALIKLFDFLTPIRPDKVTNPAFSIICEGLAAFIVYSALEKQSGKKLLITSVILSALWRVFYIVYLLFIPQWMYDISVLVSREKLIRFLIFENGINALTVYACFSLSAVFRRIAPEKT